MAPELTHHACVLKPLLKTLNEGVWRVTHPSSMGIEAPALWTLLDLALCTSTSACSSVSFTISFLIDCE